MSEFVFNTVSGLGGGGASVKLMTKFGLIYVKQALGSISILAVFYNIDFNRKFITDI